MFENPELKTIHLLTIDWDSYFLFTLIGLLLNLQNEKRGYNEY